MNRRFSAWFCNVLVCLSTFGVFEATHAQSKTTQQGIDEYRAMLTDGNPAELIEAQGEILWNKAAGPNLKSLNTCDLGLGEGIVKGAYARLPRYFIDADRVMDAETRIVHCMVTLQGRSRNDVIRNPFSAVGDKPTELEAITAYVVGQSRGARIAVPQTHPKEKEAYAKGEKIFYYRGGPYDFSCASCHGVEGQRTRLQELPVLTESGPAQAAFSTWPGYRVSQGALRTMQWRMYDCFRQQRFPELKYASPVSVDLITFLGVKAQGGVMDSPALKR